MARISRREWHRIAIGGFAAAAAATAGADSRVRGLRLGTQSYSFRDRPLDEMVRAVRAAGISSCELWQGHVEPKLEGAALHQWRMSVPLDHFRSIRRMFDRAGVNLSAYNLSFQDDYSDDEIRRGFEMAVALGVKVITASANKSVVTRVAPLAKRFRITVGMHNHWQQLPNEFATPEDFTRAMAVSPWITTNLDIGHFTAAGFDAVQFLTAHHDRIVSLHIKDAKRNSKGVFVPFGEGDAPIAPVLKLLRDRRWAIPANLEYEYAGGDSIDEVKRCLEYCTHALYL